MKKIISTIFTFILLICIAGCGSNDTDYSRYTGTWAEKDFSLENGGVVLEIDVVDEWMNIALSQTSSAPANRVAEISHSIKQSQIENSIVEFHYPQDSWGNSGIVELTFKEDSIYCEIKDVTTSDMAMWQLHEGLYKLINSNYFNKTVSNGEASDYMNAFASNIKDVISNYGRYVNLDYIGIEGLKYGDLVDFEKDGIPELVLCVNGSVRVYRFDGKKSSLIYEKVIGGRFMQTDVSPTFGINKMKSEPLLLTYHSTDEWHEECIHIFTIKNEEPQIKEIFASRLSDDEFAEFDTFKIDGRNVSKNRYNAYKDSIYDGEMEIDALWNNNWVENGNRIGATEAELNTFLSQFGM